MDFYALPSTAFADHRPWPFHHVTDVDALNRRIAEEAVGAIESAGRNGHQLLIITPTGPLDYTCWADLCNRRRVSCAPLTTVSMDEYLDEASGDLLPLEHPLSFRRYLQTSFINHLDPVLRPDPANVHFPDPHDPQRTTAMIEANGGADLCYGGFGITGHFAFNDPPEPEDPCDDNDVRDSRTRCVKIMRESQVQMAMGGSHGNFAILPRRAVTLGMHELLMSKRIHLTFMRSWHAGVLRRALFGPVTGRCPGSFIQAHPNVTVTMTRLAATLPTVNVTQSTGEP